MKALCTPNAPPHTLDDIFDYKFFDLQVRIKCIDPPLARASRQNP
jgi:hypothetical protein